MMNEVASSVFNTVCRLIDLNDGNEVNAGAVQHMHQEFTGERLSQDEVDEAMSQLMAIGYVSCRIGSFGTCMLKLTLDGMREEAVRGLLHSMAITI